MSTTLTIGSIDDIRRAIDALLGDLSNDYTLSISPDFSLLIKLRGDSWQGYVDARVAHFVTELQHAFNRAQTELGFFDTSTRPRVLLKVGDGSTELVGDILKTVEKWVDGMNSREKFLIVLAVILVTFGGVALHQVLGHLQIQHAATLSSQTEIRREELGHEAQTQTLLEMNETLQMALKKIDPEKPLRGLVKSMSDADTIQLPDTAEPISKTEAKSRFHRKPRVAPTPYYIDDNFTVASVVMAQPVTLNLELGDISFSATLASTLQGDDRETFLENIKRALETGATPRVPLQINANVNDRAVVTAHVVGIGKPPRPNSEDLTKLFD